MKVLAIIVLSIIAIVIIGGMSYLLWCASGFWWLGIALFLLAVLIAVGINWGINQLTTDDKKGES